MYATVIVIHVVVSLFLIAVILLQAGKGGGLSDTFGGSQMQNLFGTKSANVLTKLTAVCAIGFIATCITLAVLSSHQAKSIVDNVRIPQPVTSQAETQAPQAQAPAPVEPAPQGETNEVK